MNRFLCFLTFFLMGLGLQAQDTITVMQYNLLEYGNDRTGWSNMPCNESNNNTQDKDENIRIILNYVQPDILTVNEFGSTAQLQDDFIRHNLNLNGVNYWRSDNIVNYAHSNIINHIFYNSDKMVLKKHAVIRTAVRDIDAYELYFKTPALASHDTIKLVCMVAHLKAGDSNSNIDSRYTMLQNAMYYIEEHYPNDNVLIMGDFNMNTSDEKGYRLITQTYPNHDILFEDPLSLVGGVGAWHNSGRYAAFHTQSPIGWSDDDCHSGGGMDDRFDMILMSDEILMGFNKVKYVNNSYHAVGNDGNHFNMSINQGANNAVPATVANALYHASDHLPVAMKLAVYGHLAVDEHAVGGMELFPNPTHDALHIETINATSAKDYRITNALGQTLMTGAFSHDIDVSALPNGLYFISVGEQIGKFVKY